MIPIMFGQMNAISQSYDAQMKIQQTNDAMMGLMNQASNAAMGGGPMNMAAMARFGKALEMQGQQARMMYAVNQALRESYEKQLPKAIESTFKNPFA